MYGTVEFYKAAKAAGITPVIGCEVYVAKQSMEDKQGRADREYSHLILLAENQTGYRNLIQLVSMGCLLYTSISLSWVMNSRMASRLIARSWRWRCHCFPVCR